MEDIRLLLTVTLTFFFLGTKAQGNKGIQFLADLSWEQIKQKAKTENKFIFVDCYATWCGPCHFMTDSVFTRGDVGEVLNKKFISVKVQMDTSKDDNEQTKSWYRDAKDISEKYKINIFPTYLFFASDGQIVHKANGIKPPKMFITEAENATDSGNQFYTLLRAYRLGERKFEALPTLAIAARNLGEAQLADTISQDYINSYLLKLPEHELYTKTNIEFICSFLKDTKSSSFELLYYHSDKVDATIGENGFARCYIDYLISKDNIDPFIKLSVDGGFVPNWSRIENEVKCKYGTKYAERNIYAAKARFYSYKKDWNKYTKYLILQMEKSEIETLSPIYKNAVDLNNSAWAVFQYSNKKEELQKAFLWIERAFTMVSEIPGFMLDTKANLFYKLGREDEAIVLEEKAVKMYPKLKELQDTLEKMRKGKPTWPTSH